jgi:hypothetical protein
MDITEDTATTAGTVMAVTATPDMDTVVVMPVRVRAVDIVTATAMPLILAPVASEPASAVALAADLPVAMWVAASVAHAPAADSMAVAVAADSTAVAVTGKFS